MSPTSGLIGFTVTDGGTGKDTISVGVSTTLTLALVNNSADATLAANTQPFTIYLPTNLFSVAQFQGMTVTTPGWKATPNASKLALVLTCAQDVAWAKGTKLTLTIANVVSSGPPASGTVTVQPAKSVGVKMPLQADAPLAVANPPKPGNLALTDVLQIGLDEQGTILRSTSADPLTNKLFLNLKNVGTSAIATAGTSLPGSPQIVVSFVYGNTSGALAPDDKDTDTAPDGSAWNIKVAMGPAQTLWTAFNPPLQGQLPHPQWVLKPSSTNRTILGPAGSDEANVTFEFNTLKAFTPAGHTQMLVLCTGFAKDANTRYDDHLYVLDIIKEDPPPTRGLLSFSAREPVIDVTDPKEKPEVSVQWRMLDVASVNLVSSMPSVPPVTVPYPDPQPLAHDETKLTLPQLRTSEAVFLTLQSFDGGGFLLNSLQFAVYAKVGYVVDPGGHVYAIGLFGDTYWMLHNYAFVIDDGSYTYADQDDNQDTYGRLYEWSAAQESVPDGWAIPSVDDWKALIDLCGGEQKAFAQLTAAGDGAFEAQLGGQRTIDPRNRPVYSDMYDYGYYWASERHVCAQFSQGSGTASVGGTVDRGTALSVRYVRHA